jgi:hypothetical protein
VSRDLDPTLEAAIEEPVVRPFFAFRIELPDPVTVWTGSGTLTFDDSDGDPREWLGAGTLGSFEPIGESSDGSATGIRLSLRQIPLELADDIADQAARGVLMEVYVGTLNETMQTVDAVHLLQKYRLDEYKVFDAGTSLTVEIAGESRAIDKMRPAIKRFTDEEQQRRHPGDRALEYLPQMAEVPILWAQAEQKGGGVGGGGGGGGAGIDLVQRVINSIR